MIRSVKSLCQELKFWSIATIYLEIAIIVHLTKSYQTIEYSLRENNFYSDLDDLQRDSVFSYLCSSTNVIMCLVASCNGFIVDRFGTWVSRCIAHVFVITGLIILMNISSIHENLIWLGYPLFCSGGYLLADSSFLTYVLYPNNLGSLTSFSGLGLSAAQLWYLWYKNICVPIENTKIFWIVILCFQPLSILRTFLLMPKLKVTKFIHNIGWKTRYDDYAELNQKISDFQGENNTTEKSESDSDLQKSTKPVNQVSFWKEITKFPVAIFMPFWFLANLRNAQYFTLYQPWLRSETENPDQISNFTKLFTVLCLVSIITEPIFGRILDVLIKYFEKRGRSNFNATILVTNLGFIWSTLCMTMISVSQAIGPFGVGNIISAGTFVALNDSVRWSCRFIFLYTIVDPRVAPRILSTTTFIGVLSSLVAPQFNLLVSRVFDGNWDTLNWIFASVSFMSGIVPICILYFYSKTNRN